jgi:hypothetical protein
MAQWRNKDALLAAIVLFSAATAAGAVTLLGIPAGPCSGVKQEVVEFTIVADLNGYNGSKTLEGQGPFISVHSCNKVIINLANHDIQAHGMAIDFYANGGLEATGGDTVSLSFLAYRTGSFRVFCNTSCSVHSYMQHAQLSVVCTSGSGCT